MLKLEGQVIAVITHPERTGRDGQTYEAYSQVQLQVEEELESGQLRYGIHTLTTDSPDQFAKCSGKLVSVPVRAYAKSGKVAFTMAPRCIPEPVQPTKAAVTS